MADWQLVTLANTAQFWIYGADLLFIRRFPFQIRLLLLRDLQAYTLELEAEVEKLKEMNNEL